MRNVRDHIMASAGVLLLLQTVQIAFESVAAAFVYRGQILPAYSFFPTQLYDFVVKIRWAAEPYAAWLPGLPQDFREPSALGHLAVLLDLLPAGIATALVLGVLGGLAGALVFGRRTASVRSYLALWAAVGLIVHIATAVPPVFFEGGLTLRHIVYRSRSLVVDGTVVALAVFGISLAVTFSLAPLLARTRIAARTLSAAVLALAVLTSLSGASGTAAVSESRPAAPVAPASGQRPNVVLISLDSLRADHVGCYGYERNTSPNIDKLAAEGVRFARAISTSSWTLPTHLTMFTSRYQLSHGVTHETFALNPSVPTLGEIMKANGYSTAGFVSAPYVAAHYGYARGMDVYEDLSATYGHREEARSAIVSPQLTDMVLPWLEKHRSEPFFLFVHNFDIHYDYIPPPPYDTMFDPDYRGNIDGTKFIERADVNKRMDPRDLAHILALYDGEIRFTDEHVGKILGKIDELGLRDRTLVVLVSDHGDEFFEHGNKGHHRTVYDEVLHVPLVMRFPGLLRAATVVDEQVSLVDLMPTILATVGIETPPGAEGISLLPLALGQPSAREAIYAEFFDKRGFNLQVAQRTRTAKVIQHFNRITHPRSEPIELYDLAKDTREQRNLARGSGRSNASDELARMSAWLDERWTINRVLEQSGSGQHVDIDDETMERLKSLGYVAE